MNYDKFDPHHHEPEFLLQRFLGTSFETEDCEGRKLFRMNREDIFKLLKNLKFKELTDSHKRSISYLIEHKKRTGQFPSVPKHPIKINLDTYTIENGVRRLFYYYWLRSEQLLWIELVGGE